MRRTAVSLVLTVAVAMGAAACGGSESTDGTTTTAPNSGSQPTATGGSSAVDAYCAKVAELAQVVAEKGTGATADVQRISDELKTLSTDAAKSLPGNPDASKQFGECSVAASKKIVESYGQG